MKRVTVQDIADALGVSRNTVSKAINNTDGLADATREKVLQKAVEMGYKQFSYVAALSGNSAFIPAGSPGAPAPAGEIAVFIGKPFLQSNHFAVTMLDRFQQEAAQLGYTLNIYRVDRENLAQRTLPATFDVDRVRAMMCIEMFDRAYDEMVCGLGLPVLFVDGPNKRSGDSLPADQLYMDNTAGITKLVNDLLRKGKQKIGFIGDYEHCQSFFERYTAFRSAMMMAGVTVNEAFCIKSNNDLAEMDALLGAMPELPEVFICGNDFIALDVVQSLRKLGKSIPDDILLCGFDDAPEARIMTPALTTVHIHTQIMAYTAVQLLLTRMREPYLDYRTVYTATELICRDSTRVKEESAT